MIQRASFGPSFPIISMAIAVFVLACEEKPARLRIDGEPPKAVFGTVPVALPKATVLDAKDQPLKKQPVVSLESRSPAVAMVENGHLVPLANGEVELRYHLPGTPLEEVRKVSINLVDRIELECPELGCDVPTGKKARLKVRFFHGGGRVENVAATWESSNPTSMSVDAEGVVLAEAAGVVTVSVKLGTLEKKLKLRALGQSEPDRIELSCRSENTDLFDADQGCRVRRGAAVPVQIEASAGGAPVVVPLLTWTSADPDVAKVAQADTAEALGLALGTTKVTARVGSTSATLKIMVVPPPCSETSSEMFTHKPPEGRSVPVTCHMERADTCFYHYVNKKNPTEAQVEEALGQCCCELRIKEEEPEEEGAVE